MKQYLLFTCLSPFILKNERKKGDGAKKKQKHENWKLTVETKAN